MISFPNGKINLGLNIVRKRTDGFHDLETVFYPVAIKDALEVIASPKTGLQISGLPVDANADSNLCLKAYHLLKKDFPDLPAVSIHLHKAIPIGAGLGGGSADGAFMLTMLNKKFQLNLSEDQLITYALQLGSDCPFFILNKPCFATSRGEILSPVKADLSEYKMVIINPGIHISTKKAFSNLTPAIPAKSIQQIVEQPIAIWKDELVNDFEKSIFQMHYEIKEIKTQMYNRGALYASMTGSGSTVFGIFEPNAVLHFSYPQNYMMITLS